MKISVSCRAANLNHAGSVATAPPYFPIYHQWSCEPWRRPQSRKRQCAPWQRQAQHASAPYLQPIANALRTRNQDPGERCILCCTVGPPAIRQTTDADRSAYAPECPHGGTSDGPHLVGPPPSPRTSGRSGGLWMHQWVERSQYRSAHGRSQLPMQCRRWRLVCAT